ncbi:MAG: hypothetical protein ACOCZK_01455 [Planctomycetota bacterium]
MGTESAAPNLTALPVDQVARLLRHAGSEHVNEDAIRADIAAGAPTNPDGTINLVVYGAWLVRELARRGAARD